MIIPFIVVIFQKIIRSSNLNGFSAVSSLLISLDVSMQNATDSNYIFGYLLFTGKYFA